MKVFEWVGQQFSNNFFNMILYTGTVFVAGWFVGPMIPGVNKVVVSIANKFGA